MFIAYIFAIFEILSGYPEFRILVVLKCYSYEFQKYEIRISCPLVDVSIRFSGLLDFVLKALNKLKFQCLLIDLRVLIGPYSKFY